MTGNHQMGKTSFQFGDSRFSRGFTLLELLIAVGIIGILMSALGVTISNMLESAKSARTLSTLQKVEGLINERRKGLERSFTRPSFQVSVKRRVDSMVAGDPTRNIPGLPGISEKAVETVLKKDWARFYFPQTFSEFMIAAQFLNQNIDTDSTGIPDILQSKEDINGNGLLDAGEDVNGNGLLDGGLNILKHDPTTESAEMLFVALTRLESFGVQTAGEDSFTTDEVRDTDGDGLPELIDGWGNPLRFYRWPTSVLKPFGIVGKDLQPGALGVNDDGVGGNDDSVGELAAANTDDAVIEPEARIFASFLMSGLPRSPQIQGQYDLLNEDPDDPYGLVLAEMKRLSSTTPPMLNPSQFFVFESLYHSFDTYHKPLVISAGPDGLLGVQEPFVTEDLNFNGTFDAGEDLNGDGIFNDGVTGPFLGWHRAVPIDPDPSNPLTFSELTSIEVAFDNMTNRNRRAGGQ